MKADPKKEIPTRWLGLDTSMIHAALALVEGERILASCVYEVGVGHSTMLLDQLDVMLRGVGWSRGDIQAIAVGQGPGSFTGIRVGLATAQGLAWALRCPLIGVSSLDALAASAPPTRTPWIIPCVDARKGQIYTQFYCLPEAETARRWLRRSPPLMLTPRLLVQLLEKLDAPALLFGSGVSAYSQEIQPHAPSSTRYAPHVLLAAQHLVALAREALHEAPHLAEQAAWQVLPLYLRPADAEMRFGGALGGSPLASRLLPDGRILEETEEIPDVMAFLASILYGETER